MMKFDRFPYESNVCLLASAVLIINILADKLNKTRASLTIILHYQVPRTLCAR